MKCERCKIKEAHIHLKQILGQKIMSLNLCSACAADLGLDTDPSSHFDPLAALEMLAEKIGFGHSGAATLTSPDADLVGRECSACGLKGEDLARTGLLGCPVCYQHFSKHLEKTLRDLHRGMVHRGRMPGEGPPSAGNREIELARLRDDLDRAVAMEDYEKAALIRDRIFSLSAQPST